MTIAYLFLMLAGAPAAELAEPSGVTQIVLICRYETTIYPFIAKRKLCLTASEWEDLEKNRGNASRDVLRKYLGNGMLPMA